MLHSRLIFGVKILHFARQLEEEFYFNYGQILCWGMQLHHTSTSNELSHRSFHTSIFHLENIKWKRTKFTPFPRSRDSWLGRALPRAAQMASVGGQFVLSLRTQPRAKGRTFCRTFANRHLWRPGAVGTLRLSVWIRFCFWNQEVAENVQLLAFLEYKYFSKHQIFHEYARLGLIGDVFAWASERRLTKKGCQQHQKILSVCVCSKPRLSPTLCLWLFFF